MFGKEWKVACFSRYLRPCFLDAYHGICRGILSFTACRFEYLGHENINEVSGTMLKINV